MLRTIAFGGMFRIPICWQMPQQFSCKEYFSLVMPSFLRLGLMDAGMKRGEALQRRGLPRSKSRIPN